MQTSLKLKTCSRYFIPFPKSSLNLEYFEKKNQCYSLSITEIINRETGSYLNVQKGIFHAKIRQTTCYRFPNTAEINWEHISYHSSIDLRYWEWERLVLVTFELLGQFVKTLTADYKYSR